MFDSPLVALYVLTTTGSAAFFGAGYGAGRLRSLRRAAQGEREAAARRAELEARAQSLEGALAGATERCCAAEGALAQEQAQAAAAAERVQALEAEARAQLAEVGGLRGRLTELEAAARAPGERVDRAGGGALAPAVGRGPREPLERLEQELQRARRDQQQARQELQRVQQELRQARAEPSKAQLELTRARQELEQARQELTAERSARAKHDTEAKGRAEQSALRDAELARRSGRIEALEAEQARRDEQIRALERELGAREAGPPSSPNAELLAELARVQARCQELEAREAEARRLADDLVALQQRLNEVEGEREDLEVRQAGAAAYVRRAQDEAKRISERATRLEAELVELRSIPPPIPAPARVVELEREVSLLRSATTTAGREETQQLRLRISQLEPRAVAADRFEAENAALRDRVDELKREVAETADLRQRLAALEARLFALGEPAASAPGVPRSDGATGAGPVSTAAELAELAASPSVRCATLADGHGLQVAAAGEPEAQEGLAAVTGLAGHLAAQAVQILPLAEVTDVTFRDRNALVVSCRLFDCHGDPMALATLGTAEPPAGQIDRIVVTVLRALAQPEDEPGAVG